MTNTVNSNSKEKCHPAIEWHFFVISALVLRDTIAAEGPAAEHGEIVKVAGAVLLDGHRGGNHHPAGGTLHGDADGLIGRDARQSRHIHDVRLGVVLMRRRPFLDNHSDGVEAVLMIVSTREQLESCSPAPLHRLKHYEGSIGLLFGLTLPLIPVSTDIQWVTIS